MQKDSSIDLGPHYERFVARQVLEGHFSSASEAVRAALRLLEEQEAKLEVLRQALKQGEESGKSNYSLDKLMQDLDREDLH
jgi:antitoxin ParD1/3/4